ncbi:unnamed protein product [Notodromas monacha]|uniref:BHLH domain-containing protein n=1 Tax=Notodromas monacha TaxID=399045 RepID=A0A7R9GIM0_9CRUS|nr:unnamed protein product [Notodromas monacha]CAG0924101.1 unnamed protein product [Notodromas monacha]
MEVLSFGGFQLRKQTLLLQGEVRRAHLKTCLERLKEMVPLGPDSTRHTTLGLLRRAKAYIKNLEEKERQYVNTKESLTEKRELLTIRFRQLSASLGLVQGNGEPLEPGTSFRNPADPATGATAGGGGGGGGAYADSLSSARSTSATSSAYSSRGSSYSPSIGSRPDTPSNSQGYQSQSGALDFSLKTSAFQPTPGAVRSGQFALENEPRGLDLRCYEQSVAELRPYEPVLPFQGTMEGPLDLGKAFVPDPTRDRGGNLHSVTAYVSPPGAGFDWARAAPPFAAFQQ